MKCDDEKLNICVKLSHIVLNTKISLYRSYVIKKVSSDDDSHTTFNVYITCVLNLALIVETRQFNICLSRIIVKFKIFLTNIVCKFNIWLIYFLFNFNIKSRFFNTCCSFSHVTRLTSIVFVSKRLIIVFKKNVKNNLRNYHKLYYENLYKFWFRDLRLNLI